MKRYLRFGDIPEYERSLNYFTYLYEDGVSVFDLTDDNEIVLTNMKLIFSLACRLVDKAFIVKGDEVGRGNDGEPLIKNIEIVEEFKGNRKNIAGKIHDILKKYSLEQDGERYLGQDRINKLTHEREIVYLAHTFYKYPKKCLHCNKILEEFESCLHGKKKGKYERLTPYVEIYFDGVDYLHFVDGFDIETGRSEEHCKKKIKKGKRCLNCDSKNINEIYLKWHEDFEFYKCKCCGAESKYLKRDY